VGFGRSAQGDAGKTIIGKTWRMDKSNSQKMGQSGEEDTGWHRRGCEAVMGALATSTRGLTAPEALLREIRYGANQLSEKKKKSILLLFLSQFRDVMIAILGVAAVVSAIIGDLTDSFIILAIAVINAVIGFVQEYRADKAMEELKQLGAPMTTVVRDNKIQEIATIELVPGDVVLLETGMIVPADLRLYETHSLRMMESSLTGESLPVEKFKDPIDGDVPLGDRNNMAFSGTVVAYGRGAGIVVSTGMRTEMGRISGLLQEEPGQMPLQRRMAALGKRLSLLILAICLILFFIGILRKQDPAGMLLVVISLAVAAIPEALPAVTTVLLAIGAKRLVKEKALIRKLAAVETLGSVSVICTDKTGTLTQNKMRVSKIREHAVSLPLDAELSPLECAMVLNNDVHRGAGGTWIGDPTETALMEYVDSRYGGAAIDRLRAAWRRVAEVPFDGSRRCMTTVNRSGDRTLLISKGAIEVIAGMIAGGEDPASILAFPEEMAAEGYRVLAFAWKLLEEAPNGDADAEMEKDLSYMGAAALADPPRKEAAQAIRECRMAGIRPVMITGDHPETANTIARQLGLLPEGSLALTGVQLAAMPPAELEEKVDRISVYARVSPEQKLRIVKALQKKGSCVAMTGDGVNDAPALRAADIGIAMGLTGTDVSREAAHMILLDDNFATIVKAVKEGRRIYDNIRKFLKYILTCNSAEILTVFLAPIAGLPMPLLPVQILWINLVTDGLPGLALAFEKAEPDIMKRAPRPAAENLLAGSMGLHILWAASLMAGVTLGLQAYTVGAGVAHWQTMVFALLSFSQLGHVFAIRRDHELNFRLGVRSNLALYCSSWPSFTFL
jgi:Ca2+-transporting ATPase